MRESQDVDRKTTKKETELQNEDQKMTNKKTAWQDIDRSTALALPASRVYIL
jgi:hypothetical protein